MPSETPRIEAALTNPQDPHAPGRSAAEIADTAVLTWHAVHATLTPVIGARGVHALYRRTLYVTRDDHPWLDRARVAAEPDDFTDLRTALAQQTSAVAADGHSALLRHFLELLKSLIGESLTERLLRSVWTSLPGGDAARDTTQ